MAQIERINMILFAGNKQLALRTNHLFLPFIEEAQLPAEMVSFLPACAASLYQQERNIQIHRKTNIQSLETIKTIIIRIPIRTSPFPVKDTALLIHIQTPFNP